MIIFHVYQRKEHSLRKKQKMLGLSPCQNILCFWRFTKHVLHLAALEDVLLLICLSIEKNNRIIHNYQHCPLKKFCGLFFVQKQNFSAYCKKAVRLHRRKREPKKSGAFLPAVKRNGNRKKRCSSTKKRGRKKTTFKIQKPTGFLLTSVFFRMENLAY